VIEGPRRVAGSGEPLVLLHGIGHSLRAWSPVLGALEARHRVLALDLPGFGDAPPLPPATVPTVDALADAVEQEMEGAGIDTAHLAGNSMGGRIALELARRGRARSVIAISPAGGGNERERAYSRWLLKTFWVATKALAPVAYAVALPGPTRTLLYGTFFARPNRLPREQAAQNLRDLARGPRFAETCDLLFEDRAGGLEQVGCPVTIAWGTRDFVLFPRQARHFLAAMPHATHVQLPRLGHVPMWDDPARLADVILGGTATRRPAPAPGLS
jgi:pimeloyl-ACP methyl ester carboxylesterase